MRTKPFLMSILTVVLGMILVAISGAFDLSMSTKLFWCIWFLGLIVMAIGILLLVREIIILDHKQKIEASRPIVHVWEHNGIKALSAEADYKLWYCEKERGLLVNRELWQKQIPFPTLTAFFSDDPIFAKNYPEYFTGNLEDLEKLTRNCRVLKSETWIPKAAWGDYALRAVGNVPVKLPVAYRLVYGENSTPPAE